MKWREGKRKWECLEAFRAVGGRRGGSCTSVDAEKGQGNKGGLFSLSVLAGRLFSSPFFAVQGGDAGLCLRRSTKEARVFEFLFEHTVVPPEEGC